VPFQRRVVRDTESLGMPVIFHICGDATEELPLIADTGVAGVSVDDRVPIGYAKEVLAGRSALIGNINSSKVLHKGTPEIVKEETRNAIEPGVDVVAPGCDLLIGTPTANLAALISATTRFGGRP
jgi:uroporphyrinogen-III decarboxylase